MRDRLFRLILYASAIQQFLLFTAKGNIPEINFLYGVPVTRQAAYHAMLFGYWYLPVFFIVYYFSGYFSCVENYELIALVKHEKRCRYFARKLLGMAKELAVLAGAQVLAGIVADAVRMQFFNEGIAFFRMQNIKNVLIALLNYFIVMAIMILLQNTLELFFEDVNGNVIINIFIITSVFVYNYNGNLRQGVFKLVNVAMYARVHVLAVKEYGCLLFVLCGMIGIMFCCWKRKDLLGRKI